MLVMGDVSDGEVSETCGDCLRIRVSHGLRCIGESSNSNNSGGDADNTMGKFSCDTNESDDLILGDGEDGGGDVEAEWRGEVAFCI